MFLKMAEFITESRWPCKRKCPDCVQVTITFDDFCEVSLDIAHRGMCWLIRGDSSKPIRCAALSAAHLKSRMRVCKTKASDACGLRWQCVRRLDGRHCTVDQIKRAAQEMALAIRQANG